MTLTVIVLGRTVLNFKISVAQILVCILLAAVIGVAAAFFQDRVLMWPASALQTGVSVALIFRVSGTGRADLWSLHGVQYFVVVVALALGVKQLLRVRGRHVFNPANLGISAGLLLIGPSHVFSEHLWWDPLGAPVIVSFVVLVAGAGWVLRQVRMLPMAIVFLVTFSALIGVLTLTGSSYVASWYDAGPVAGGFYFSTVAFSPEVLIFVFFMMSDPQTAPRSQLGRVIYAIATAALAAALIASQSTEFGIKVAILASLIVSCALVPSFEALAERIRAGTWKVDVGGLAGKQAFARRLSLRRLALAVRSPVLLCVLAIAVAAPVATTTLSRDSNLVRVELGLGPPGSGQ